MLSQNLFNPYSKILKYFNKRLAKLENDQIFLEGENFQLNQVSKNKF